MQKTKSRKQIVSEETIIISSLVIKDYTVEATNVMIIIDQQIIIRVIVLTTIVFQLLPYIKTIITS